MSLLGNLGLASAEAAWAHDSPWIDHPNADADDFCAHYKRNYPGLPTQLKEWQRSGALVLEQAVPHDLIDTFINELDHLRNNFHQYLIPMEVRGKQTWSRAVKPETVDEPQTKINNLHVASLHAARLSLSRPILDFLHAIFLAPPIPMQSLTFLRGSQQPTHIDYPYVKVQRRLPFMAASWIALEDVKPEAGPLCYFLGSHRTGVTGFFDWGQGSTTLSAGSTKRPADFSAYLNSRLQGLGREATVFLPKKGDVLIWHANIPHLGSAVEDPKATRMSYVTHYTGLFDYPVDWIPHSPRDAKYGVSANGGAVFEYPWDKTKTGTKLPSWSERQDSNDLRSVLDVFEAGEAAYAKSLSRPSQSRVKNESQHS